MPCYNITIRQVIYVAISKYCIVVSHLKAICCSFMLHTSVSDMAKPFSVVVFHCRHMFHKECLPSQGTVNNCVQFVPKKSHHFILFNVRFYMNHIRPSQVSSGTILFYLRRSNITQLSYNDTPVTFSSSFFRFLGSSFVTSAVRRGEGQEVEYLR